MGAQLIKVGSECQLVLRLHDLGSTGGAKAATVAGGCAEAEVLASVKLGVRRLAGVQLKKPELRFAAADHGLVAQAPEATSGAVRGLDFGQVDVEALELFDLAVRAESDATSTARQKIEAWKAVEAKAPEYANVAKERQRVWLDSWGRSRPRS